MNKTLFYDEQGFFFIEPYNALEAYQIFTHIKPYVSTSLFIVHMFSNES